jgi:hypothetical protein
MIFESWMGLGKSKCDVLIATTQGWACPKLLCKSLDVFNATHYNVFITLAPHAPMRQM